MVRINSSSVIFLYLLVQVLSGDQQSTNQVQAAARLIRLPLQRSTTQGVGEFSQPLINYYTPIGIGTPPKPFNVQFDISLSELIVPHYSWNPFNRNLHYSNGFQCKVSSTCVKDDRSVSASYQNCKLTGKKYEDIFSFIDARQNSTIPVTNQTHKPFSWKQNFLAISSASDGRFSSLPVDAFFGLSPANQSPNSVTNILLNLHQAGQIDNIQFSFWFNPVLDSVHGGELILGGVDPTRYQGQIYWHHLPSLSFNEWSMNLQYVSLGNQIVSCSGQQCKAVLSTGYSDIYGPAEDVKRIYNLLNTSHQSSGMELIDCRRIPNLPILTFNIDGIPYALLPSNYIRKTLDGVIFKSETCYVAILPSSGDSKQWILGTNFLGAYYAIFDLTYRQIGFAALR